ncbi:hypothetical protein ZOSMA_363G00030 [Zostera marina]|uniref:Growth-regulating factor n=1 Tax=Zostera marina TaxID=29655 RepID=A0A0K9P666_ZOSMR|nr:hypothetical protein ZOSMA_363G00030 [Zostera marina]
MEGFSFWKSNQAVIHDIFNRVPVPYSHRRVIADRNDPEPGRCRRTDGRKWRCARSCLPHSKYCERHINRSATKPYTQPSNTTTSVDHPDVAPIELPVNPTNDPLKTPHKDLASSSVNLNDTNVEDSNSSNNHLS